MRLFVLLLVVVLACGCAPDRPTSAPISVPVSYGEAGMFGYLNLGNPIAIGKEEAQEANNCRVDRGLLEYATWETSPHPGRQSPIGTSVVSGAVAHIAATFPAHGVVKWTYSGMTSQDILGLDKPATAPTIAAQAHGSQPYPAGDYTYAVTLYNPTTGEESKPYLLTVTIGTNEVARFTLFPAFGPSYPLKTGLKWRIYRLPLGGDEFLLVDESISAVSAYAGPFDDTVTDDNLGAANDTEDDGYYGDITAAAVSWYASRLWIVFPSGQVRYSRINKPWAFPTDNVILTGITFAGAFPYGESMVLPGKTGKGQIVYGDDETNFVAKEMDTESLIAPNTGRVIGGVLVMALMEQALVDGTTTSQESAVSGIAVFDGARPILASTKIKSKFPRVGTFYPAPSLSYTMEALTGQAENRFYILELNASDLPVTPSSVSRSTFKIIMDVFGKGFLTADSGATFQYRTKEFPMPRDRNIKRIWFEAEGDLTVDVLIDGESSGPDSFSLATRDMQWVNAPPWVGKHWSVRFVGNSNAKVYGWGVEKD